jgi:rhodanese-related sulfurtransferase
MNATARPPLGPQFAALGLMLLVLAAALRFTTPPDATAAQPPAWLTAIETGADHIDARELADELLANRPGLVLVDVRPLDEYRRFHLPGAIRLTIPELCGSAGTELFAAKPRLVVLYSNGPAHPGQAWVELRRQGREQVRVLAGGLDEFAARLLTPPSLREPCSATPDPAAQADHRALLARCGLAHHLPH